MPGFSESQMGLNFNPAERPPAAPERPESKLEQMKKEALRMIGRVNPHEDLEELYLVPAEEIEGGSPDMLLFRRPQDSDRALEEKFFEVRFENGRPQGVRNPRPVKESMEQILKKKGKRRYN